ncbi:MAG TPA: chemotaxis protein CheB [Gemmatimonadaceae bacterium]|nr:chemotaxis protein CheB [Gemmatimonadaceae bacterium]
MAGRDVVCIGASAGGVEMLIDVVRQLPADFPGAVFVVLHVPPDNPSVLASLLDRRSALHARYPTDRELIERGVIYVAPPDHHLLVKRGHVRITRGPRESGFRPAVDPLFRTAAVAYRERTVGVVLSGNLDDGTVGLAAIKRYGGVAIAQDPVEAIYSGMPQSAIDRVGVDHIVRLKDLGPLLTRLAHEPVAVNGAPMTEEDEELEMEADIAEMDSEAITQAVRPGTPSGYGCPDCGGALYALRNGDIVHFRCRVGHAWSTDALMNRTGETLDAALWTALRALEENMSLSLSVAERMRARGNALGAKRFAAQAEVAHKNAETIRAVLSQDRGAGSIARDPARLHSDATAIVNGMEPNAGSNL